MNYKPNTTNWKMDDIVIHDADAKNKNMLMKVIGYDGDRIITEYIYRDGSKTHYLNRKEVLHAPERFISLNGKTGTKWIPLSEPMGGDSTCCIHKNECALIKKDIDQDHIKFRCPLLVQVNNDVEYGECKCSNHNCPLLGDEPT